MKSLNPEQQAAVKQIDRPLLVLAGAGSGKTRVITEKIAYLVRQGLAARHIAALTFTNKAAREMQSRVGKLLHGNQSHGLRVSTFHSLGLDILRKEYKVLGYKPAITLFDEYDKMTVIKSLLAQEVGTYDNKDVETDVFEQKNPSVILRQKQSLSLLIETWKFFSEFIKDEPDAKTAQLVEASLRLASAKTFF